MPAGTQSTLPSSTMLLRQALVQAPITQAWPMAQALLQAPQFFASFWRFTSQPSAPTLLQSAKPWLHETSWQTEFTHEVTPLGSVHGLLQPPQFIMLPMVLVSQPSPMLNLQSAKPGGHPTRAHLPAWHATLPLGAEHRLPHVPQFFTSLE